MGVNFKSESWLVTNGYIFWHTRWSGLYLLNTLSLSLFTFRPITSDGRWLAVLANFCRFESFELLKVANTFTSFPLHLSQLVATSRWMIIHSSLTFPLEQSFLTDQITRQSAQYESIRLANYQLTQFAAKRFTELTRESVLCFGTKYKNTKCDKKKSFFFSLVLTSALFRTSQIASEPFCKHAKPRGRSFGSREEKTRTDLVLDRCRLKSGSQTSSNFEVFTENFSARCLLSLTVCCTATLGAKSGALVRRFGLFAIE